MDDQSRRYLAFAEFFAGIGLMRAGIEAGGPWQAAWANDIDERKFDMYELAYPADDAFHLGDVAAVKGSDLPSLTLATASFPCVDLSLAGYRRGLSSLRSGTLWHFTRLLDEMGDGRPPLVLLENVQGFATSNKGADLADAIAKLNDLGYSCDLFQVDALHFVPQSRPRLFVVGVRGADLAPGDWTPSVLRPAWVARFVKAHPGLRMHARPLLLPTREAPTLTAVIEPLAEDDDRWWNPERVRKFYASMAPLHRARIREMYRGDRTTWGTAYRRTRHGIPRAEVRVDGTAGCLRTMRGGSSRQILVEAGRHRLKVRFMIPAEYARLMGAPDFPLSGLREHQALFGFGDAVCVPVIKWIAETYLSPLALSLAISEPATAAAL
jgi:DNA (cytosine-5)-methyltransferase 1